MSTAFSFSTPFATVAHIIAQDPDTGWRLIGISFQTEPEHDEYLSLYVRVEDGKVVEKSTTPPPGFDVVLADVPPADRFDESGQLKVPSGFVTLFPPDTRETESRE